MLGNFFVKKKIFIRDKKPPTFVKLLFALYIVNREKKIFQFVIFQTFLFEFRLHLMRRFQKGITLGVLTQQSDPSHTHPPEPHPPPTKSMKYDSRPQVLYLFGILSPNAINFCRKKIFFCT